MATPLEYLPNCDVKDIERLLESLKYPKCTEISPLKVTAEYHRIWALSFGPGALLPKKLVKEHDNTAVTSTGTTELILRVSGSHIPFVKTENEVAMLTWLRDNTQIPVPEVLCFDSTTANPLACEYMIMARLPGVTASDVYADISAEKMDHILTQLATYHLELFSHSFDHLGGLRLAPDGAVIPGPCVEETLWQTPDIARYWPPTESYETLNPTDPNGYPTFVAWISAHVEKYCHGLRTHSSLSSWIGETEIRLLESFLQKINSPEVSTELNTGISARLAHRDLHFGQLLLDPQTFQITGVLDWEFAQVVPMPLWRRSFLWSADPARPYEELERVYSRWSEIVLGMQGGREMLDAAKWKSEMQEAVWQVCNYLRCVVEVCPRGEKEKESREWWAVVIQNLEKVGVTKG